MIFSNASNYDISYFQELNCKLKFDRAYINMFVSNNPLLKDDNQESINIFLLLWKYANPLKSVSWICGKPLSGHKQQREDIARILFICIGCLRFINIILWILLISLYFRQINNQFNHVDCDHGVSYCSQNYLYDNSCVISNDMCEVSPFDTIPVTIFLSFSQRMVFCMKDRAANGSTVQQDPSHDGVESPISLLFSWFGPLVFFYLFILFVLEALNLPFGTKEGEIAFVLMDSHGIQYTVVIFLCSLALGILLSIYQSCIQIEDGCGWRMVIIICFAVPYLLSLLALIIHCFVVVIWNYIDFHRFYTANIFFFSMHGDFLWYKFIRTAFSSLTLLEACLTWICIRLDQGARVWWQWTESHGEFERERIIDSDIDCLWICGVWLDWPTLIPTPDADQIE